MKTLTSKNRFLPLILVVIAVTFVLAYNTFASDFMPLYETNESGETYGSGRFAKTDEDMPDLIKAIGINGTVGYVKKTDLAEEIPSSPEEAMALQLSKPKYRLIPLYNHDGVTVIDQFKIGEGEPDPELEKMLTDEANIPSDTSLSTNTP